MSAYVRYERRGQAAWLILDRPERRNALSNELLAELDEAIRRVKDDPDARVLVLTGAGEEAFCAGGDLSQMAADDDPFEAHIGRSMLAAVFREMWSLGKPTIARVKGYALAGGFGLALSCDFVIASTDSVFGAPEVSIGLWPYMISVPMTLSMPPKTALQLMLTGRRVDAAEGRQLGFVTELVEPEELDDAVGRLVEVLSAASPEGTQLGRTAFYTNVHHDVEVRLRMLENALTVNLGMPDAIEGLAAFRERRAPTWRAR